MKTFTWKSIKQNRFYGMARDIKWCLYKYTSSEERQRFRVVSIKSTGRPKGNILLSRNHRCFFLEEARLREHQRDWEVLQMATIFVNLGYAVDVVHYMNDVFVPKKEYTLFVDAQWNMERIAPLLNSDCVKALHTILAHPLFHNSAELKRLLTLQERRGVLLSPRRQSLVNRAIEHADCATVRGNEFTLATYRYAHKSLYRIPLATPFRYPSPETKDFDFCRNQFLFIAGGGMVHKGLDRLLEAFAAMPQYSLTVCGPVEKEEDFVRAYHRELYETDNIQLVGWVDVTSDTFRNIANSCVALFHPSCSEGSSGSVVNCMHAGLIPVASVESGVDIYPEFGIVLKDSSIEEIREAVKWIASLPTPRLRKMAQSAWRESRENHSPEKFVEEYTKIVSRLLDRRVHDNVTGNRAAFSSPLPEKDNVNAV